MRPPALPRLTRTAVRLAGRFDDGDAVPSSAPCHDLAIHDLDANVARLRDIGRNLRTCLADRRAAQARRTVARVQCRRLDQWRKIRASNSRIAAAASQGGDESCPLAGAGRARDAALRFESGTR